MFPPELIIIRTSQILQCTRACALSSYQMVQFYGVDVGLSDPDTGGLVN
jgi:hypothetical protein